MRHQTILTEPESYSERAVARLKTLGPVLSWDEARRRPDALRRATILVVKLGVKVSKQMMDTMPHLRAIGTSTTGLNHIDMVEAKRRGIAVLSLRGETKFLRTITPTAEETIGLMIMLMRNLPWGFDAIRAGRWDKEKFYGHELAGKTLGLIGFGRLGSMVARFGKTFGMEVIACDPHVSTSVMKRSGAKKVLLDQVFKRADVVSNHVLLTEKTKNVVKRRHFRLMKPTAYYLNTARGELHDESGLLEALEKRWFAGAALDVLANEDPRGGHIKRHPLVRYARSHKNLLIVPHLGGATIESMAKTEDFIAEKVIRTVGGEGHLGRETPGRPKR